MKNNFKLIVFDLDGTLLTRNYELPAETPAIISEIKEQGFRVSVATGRSYPSARPYLEKLDIVEPVIFSNGAVLDNPETNERELISGIPLETALITFLLLKEFQLSLKVHMADGTVYKSDHIPWPDDGVHFAPGIVEENLAVKIDEDPVKIVFYDRDNHVDQLENRIKEIMGDKNNVRFFRSNEVNVEMTHINVSKGGTLSRLLPKIGIRKEEVITVGDQDNDLELIRDFGFGIVAGKGTPKILDVCKMQIPLPEEGGIKKLQEWLFTA